MDTQNIQYGALELKNIYNKNLRKGLGIAVLIHAVFITAFMILNYYNSVKANNTVIYRTPIEIFDIGMPPPINDNDKPIEKPIEDIAKLVKDPQSMTPDPVAKDKAEEMTIKTQTELDKIMGNVSKDGDSNKYVYNPDGNNGNEIKIDKNLIKDIPKDPPHRDDYNPSEVDKIPDCTNLQQVRSQIVYPEIARSIDIEGKVTIRVLVGTDGSVIKTGTMTGPEVFYDEVREKSKLLEFTSGLLGNKPVNVWVTVPFTFKLK